MDNPEVSCICPSFVFSEVLAVPPRALRWLGFKGVLGELPPLSALPVMGHFASGLDCFPPRGKLLFHQYGCTVFTHRKCRVAASVALWGRGSDERRWRAGWRLAARGGEGFVGRRGCSFQQQSLDCLCLIIWRQNFPDTADGSRSTISREWELLTWKFPPQDAAKEPRPLDSTRCSWGYCDREGETELNEVGTSSPRLCFISPLNVSRVCCSMLHSVSVASGSRGNRVTLIQTKCLQGGTLEFYVTFWFGEKKKKNGQAWISAACLGWSIKWVFISKNRTIDYSTDTIWILGGILIFWF